MARPENEPKTPLGQRLREVRRYFGDEDREQFAARLGVSRAALAYYERGERVPDSNVLAAYRERLGVNANWLISDQGEMFEQAPAEIGSASRRATVSVAGEALAAIGQMVVKVYAAEKVKLPQSHYPDEMRRVFDEVMERVNDLNDIEEWKSLLPWAEARLRKQLQEAAAEPGTGKRSA